MNTYRLAKANTVQFRSNVKSARSPCRQVHQVASPVGLSNLNDLGSPCNSPRLRNVRSPLKSAHSLPIRPRDLDTPVHVHVQAFQQLYTARCTDLGVPVLADQQAKFVQQRLTACANRSLELKAFRVGTATTEALTRLLAGSSSFAQIVLACNALGDKHALSIVKSLQTNQAVVHLDLSSNELTSEGCRQVLAELETHPSLSSLDLSTAANSYRNRLCSAGAQALARVLKHNCILAHLNITDTLLSNDGLDLLAQGLQYNKALLSLKLANNKLTGGLSRFFPALGRSGVQELSLANNSLGNAVTEGVAKLLGGKFGPTALRKLDLSKTEITLEGVIQLFEGLRINRSLIQLNLEGNYLTGSLGTTFHAFLSTNSTLQVLNMAYCSLSDGSAYWFESGLKTNTGLRTLILAHNLIHDTGATYISNGLAWNSNLTTLSLAHNKVKDQGCTALISALSRNCKLNVLNLDNNKITNSGASQLLDFIRSKPNLVKVSLEENSTDMKHTLLIADACKHRPQELARARLPMLRQHVARMKSETCGIDVVHRQIHTAVRRKRLHTVRLRQQQAKLKQMKQTDNLDIPKQSEEYCQLKLKNFQFSEQLLELVKRKKVVEIEGKIAERKAEDKLEDIAMEVRELEHARSKAKEAVALTKYDSEEVLTNLRQELKQQTASFEVAKMKLETLKKIHAKLVESTPCKHSHKRPKD